MGAVIKSEADGIQLISAGTDAEQEPFLESSSRHEFSKKVVPIVYFLKNY